MIVVYVQLRYQLTNSAPAILHCNERIAIVNSYPVTMTQAYIVSFPFVLGYALPLSAISLALWLQIGFALRSLLFFGGGHFKYPM